MERTVVVADARLLFQLMTMFFSSGTARLRLSMFVVTLKSLLSGEEHRSTAQILRRFLDHSGSRER
jgi:hypothetical protein